MKDTVKGVLGGLLGGLVTAIPWVLLYVYGGWMLSLLATFIAIGVNYGYRKFKGPVDKRLPIVIVSLSLFIVLVVTLLIIPLMLLFKEGYNPTFSNVMILYESETFTRAIFGDLAMSLLFTVLGIASVVRSAKQEVGIPVKNFNQSLMEVVSEMKEKFLTRGAFSKETAVSKSDIVTTPEEAALFRKLRIQQFIAKYRGNYYFNLKAESHPSYRILLLYLKALGVFFAILILVFLIFVFTS